MPRRRRRLDHERLKRQRAESPAVRCRRRPRQPPGPERPAAQRLTPLDAFVLQRRRNEIRWRNRPRLDGAVGNRQHTSSSIGNSAASAAAANPRCGRSVASAAGGGSVRASVSRVVATSAGARGQRSGPLRRHDGRCRWRRWPLRRGRRLRAPRHRRRRRPPQRPGGRRACDRCDARDSAAPR